VNDLLTDKVKTESRDEKFNRALGEMWREACARGRSLSFKIITGSMSPLIKVGDIVRVSRIEPTDLRIGDIVAFHDGRNVVVHRITGLVRTGRQISLRHRGDAGGASQSIDSPDIIGRVTNISKKGRMISTGTPWFRLTSRILGWRGWLQDRLTRTPPGLSGFILRQSLKPLWRLGRILLIWPYK
jgi:hypothetical protein